MSIHFVCPRGHKLSVPDSVAGQQGRCPICQERLFVPERGLDAANNAAQRAVENKAGPGTNPIAIETLDEAVPAALELDVTHAESRPPEVATKDPESTTPQPIQPPPVPGENAVAAATSPPPLPAVPSSAASVAESPPPASRAPVRWFTWQRSDAIEGYAILRPDPRQLEIVYWLASLLPFAAAFCAAPALPHMQFAGAPAWAQLMLVAAVLHMGYAAWLALLPDVTTIRVGMYLFGASAVVYLAALVAICLLGDSQLSALDLEVLRGPAAAWCGLVTVVVSFTSGACGWIARHQMQT